MLQYKINKIGSKIERIYLFPYQKTKSDEKETDLPIFIYKNSERKKPVYIFLHKKEIMNKK